MNGNDEQEHSSNCENNAYQTSSPERKMLKGPSIDDFGAKEPNLEKLPSDCLQHVLSFMTYEKVSQMRKVSKVFKKSATKLLDKERTELEKRIEKKMEMTEKKVLYPTNERSSYDMVHFLNDLHKAINNCAITDSFCTDYFDAGKLIDEANCLLQNFNCSTVLPHFQEHVYDQKPHPRISRTLAQSERAYEYFINEIFRIYDFNDEHEEVRAYFERKNRNDDELDILYKRNKMRISKTNVLKSRRRKFGCGNVMNREFLKSISKLNEDVLDLTQQATKVERVINGTDEAIVPTDESHNNRFFHMSTPSNSINRSIKMKGIPGSKRPNLATLPPVCVQNIVSSLTCDKMAQLRIVCKSFDESCKKEFNQQFDKLKQKLVYLIKYINKFSMLWRHQLGFTATNVMKDVYRFLQLCKDNYTWHLGSKYYFAAGKVMDEANCIYNGLYCVYEFVDNHLDGFSENFEEDIEVIDFFYSCRPHYSLFHLMDLVYKAVAHFKFNLVPQFFPSTQNRIYVPDFINSDDFEKESQLDLEEIKKLVEEEDAKIQEQNDRNRKLFKIISGLKKKVFILNKELSQRMNALKELE